MKLEPDELRTLLTQHARALWNEVSQAENPDYALIHVKAFRICQLLDAKVLAQPEANLEPAHDHQDYNPPAYYNPTTFSEGSGETSGHSSRRNPPPGSHR